MCVCGRVVGGGGCVPSGERGKLVERTCPSFIKFRLALQYVLPPRFTLIK